VTARPATTLLTAILLVLTACGGGGGGDGSRLVLTDDTCTYEGDATPPASETFEAELENRSSKLGAFEIAKLDPGIAFSEVEAYVESERERLADGLQIAGPPSYMTLGARAQVPAGEKGMLVSAVTPGTWVLWCAQEHPPTALFLISPALGIAS
jgi:hypothetical protein